MAGAGGDSDEQLLFRQLFTYLGYRPHTGLFEDLARRFPVASLAPLLSLPPAQAREEVLARWFGSAGLLDGRRATAHWAALDDYATALARFTHLYSVMQSPATSFLSESIPRPGASRTSRPTP